MAFANVSRRLIQKAGKTAVLRHRGERVTVPGGGRSTVQTADGVTKVVFDEYKFELPDAANSTMGDIKALMDPITLPDEPDEGDTLYIGQTISTTLRNGASQAAIDTAIDAEDTKRYTILMIDTTWDKEVPALFTLHLKG